MTKINAQSLRAPASNASEPAPASNADQLVALLERILNRSRKASKKDLQKLGSLSGTPNQRAAQAKTIAKRVAQRTDADNLLFATIDRITKLETQNAKNTMKSNA